MQKKHKKTQGTKKHQKTVLNFLFSFYDKILHVKKSQKEYKAQKSSKRQF